MAINFGWTQQSEQTIQGFMSDLPYPLFKDAYKNIKGTGANKSRNLGDIVKKVMGEMFCCHQGTGDCVAESSCGAATTLACITSYINHSDPVDVMVASEPIYGGSRIQISNGILGYSQGSFGIAAAKWLNYYGAIFRRNYQDIGIDLSVYDVNKAIRWGNPGNGCPKPLIPKGANYLIKTISKINTFSEVIDAIYNGFPVTVACNIGFDSMTRDDMGFIRRSGSWPHQQFIIGYITGKRPGALILNSWGKNWCRGGLSDEIEIFPGSYLVDAETVDLMLSAGDSWVYSDIEGYETRDLDLRIV